MTKSSSYRTERQYPANHHIHDIQPGDVISERDEIDSIQRCPHDEENPYVIINSKLIRDGSLSPECRWLLCYLLSHEKGWRINRRQIANHLDGQYGRDRIDRMFNEALAAGYMKRVDILVLREKGGALRRSKYFISETPKFKPLPQEKPQKVKKCFRQPVFQGTGSQLTEEAADKVISREVVSYPSNPPPLSSSSPPEKPTETEGISLRSERSLRSEEEEFSTYGILESTRLSPKEKRRLSREYSEPDVIRALEIARAHKVKKSLMGLLIDILERPENWPDPGQAQAQQLTPEQQLAVECNELMRISDKHGYEATIRPGEKYRKLHMIDDLAKQNDIDIMKNGYMHVVLDGLICRISLKSHDFARDIKKTIVQLR